MSRLRFLCTIVACVAVAAGAARIHASGHERTLVVTMTNDPDTNEIKVYDADSHALLCRRCQRKRRGDSLAAPERGRLSHDDEDARISSISHVSVGDPPQAWLPPLIALALIAASYVAYQLRPAVDRDAAPPSGLPSSRRALA